MDLESQWAQAGLHVVVAALAVVWCIYTSLVDVHHRIITTTALILGALTTAGAVGAAAMGPTPAASVSHMAAGGAGLGAVYLVLRCAAPSHLGGGDLRLAPCVGALGATAGLAGWLAVVCGPFVITAVCGLLQLAAGRGRHVAHGPGMAVCATAALLVVLAPNAVLPARHDALCSWDTRPRVEVDHRRRIPRPVIDRPRRGNGCGRGHHQ